MNTISEKLSSKAADEKQQIMADADYAAYAPITIIGGAGGGKFEYFGGTNGVFISKIGVWVGGWQVKSIKIWLTDGNIYQNGDWNNSTGYEEFTFQPGEIVNTMFLWGNGAGTRLGAINFTTSKGRTFDFGMTDWPRKTKYPVDCGSGLLCGVLGRGGADIDCMGFIFLNFVDSITLTEVKYTGLDNNENITKMSLARFRDTNNGVRDRDWTFGGDQSQTDERSWSITTGIELSQDVTVSASIPEIGEVGSTFSWKLSEENTYETSQSVTTGFNWTTSGTLKPGDSIDLEAMVMTGTLNVVYTAKVVVKLKSGHVFSYSLSGIYNGTAYTDIEILDTPPQLT